MKKPLKTIISKDYMNTLYHDENKSMNDIAIQFGYSKKAVMNLMDKYEIVRRDKDEARNDKMATLRARLSKSTLQKLYSDEELSTVTIAEMYGTTGGVISKVLKHYGIETRTISEGLYLRHGRVEKVDNNFFMTHSSDLFYVVGLIASDGCVGDDGRITLSMNDRDVIQYAAEVIGYKNKLMEYTREGTTSYTIGFTVPEVAAELSKYGIVPRKSLTYSPAEAIPDEYVSDFLRGVFDGDGTVVEGGKNSDRYTAGIVSGSLDFMTWLKRTLDEVLDHNVRMGLDKRGNGLYMYYFATPERIDTFARFIYGEDYAKFGMSRKKKRFINNYEQHIAS